MSELSSSSDVDPSFWNIDYFEMQTDFNESDCWLNEDAKEYIKGLRKPRELKGPLDIQRRNERERKRVRAVNEAFAKLRRLVPSVAARGKRVSKVKTLKRAAAYIEELKRALGQMERSAQGSDSEL